MCFDQRNTDFSQMLEEVREDFCRVRLGTTLMGHAIVQNEQPERFIALFSPSLHRTSELHRQDGALLNEYGKTGGLRPYWLPDPSQISCSLKH